MKKFFVFALVCAMTLGMVSCALAADGLPSAVTEVKAPEKDVPMQYISVEEAAKLLGSEGYRFLDVRKAADYAASHIPGAKGADMDEAKNGNFPVGVATMKIATKDVDDKLILVCYSGKRYAQATTNVLSAIGYDMSKVYTLEGGFTAWSKAYPDKVEK